MLYGYLFVQLSYIRELSLDSNMKLMAIELTEIPRSSQEK